MCLPNESSTPNFSHFSFQIVYSKFTDLLPKEVLDDDDPDLQVQETDNDFTFSTLLGVASLEGVRFSLFTFFAQNTLVFDYRHGTQVFEIGSNWNL